MKFIVCQEWGNTKNNHSGMAHLCRLIYKKNPNNYNIIIVPDLINWTLPNLFVSIQCKIQPYLYKIIYLYVVLKIIFKIKKGDSVFLFEYLLKERNQYIIAKILRFVFSDKIFIYGLTHLTPTRLNMVFNRAEILYYTSFLDFNLTLGSSLSKYLISQGINSDKVITTFHYVDNLYYNKIRTPSNKPLTVIVMGMQMRKLKLLEEIIVENQDVQFVVCSGFLKLNVIFNKYENVKLIGFIKEEDLKNEMAKADISLNLMIDTVGSNVITTSMAMGLVNIVSDVGSIKDYCNSENSFLCNSSWEFNEAIRKLNSNQELLNKMKIKSKAHSFFFQFENFYKMINSLK